jgi:hypothetical protein
VSAIVAGSRDVIAGPWLGEVGYELLYWAPFLRWLTQKHEGLGRRLVVLSRGGVESWYAGIASRYAEIFELATFDELAAWRAAPQIAGEDGAEPDAAALTPRKARRVTHGDVTLVERAAESLGIDDFALLHPSTYFKLMYRLRDLGAWSSVDRVSAFAPIEPPAEDVDLPERFVAVRFYSSVAMPSSPENRELVEGILGRLSARRPLVDLDTGLRQDDHVSLASAPAALRLGDLGIPPARNLAVQTAVLARAEAFVGTYGGLSYLPPLLGVPSLALYTNSGFFHQHLERAQRLFSNRGFGGFSAVHVGSREILPWLSLALSAWREA